MVLTEYVSKVILNTYKLKLQKNVINNINKDIISLHVNSSINLQTDNGCLKIYSLTKRQFDTEILVLIFVIKHCNILHLKNTELIFIAFSTNTIQKLFNKCMCAMVGLRHLFETIDFRLDLLNNIFMII